MCELENELRPTNAKQIKALDSAEMVDKLRNDVANLAKEMLFCVSTLESRMDSINARVTNLQETFNELSTVMTRMLGVMELVARGEDDSGTRPN